MPNRDYAVKKPSRKKGNVGVIFAAVFLLLLLSGIGLWWLKSTEKEKAPLPPKIQLNKAQLPSRPEEIYNYIRDLETREVPVNKKSASGTKKREEAAVTSVAQEKMTIITKPTPPQNEQAVKNTTKLAEQAKNQGKFGLQCGAFKNRAQAENMQARLAMAGYNANINSASDWNRVVIGPIGNRAAAVAAQSNAKNVADCLVISM